MNPLLFPLLMDENIHPQVVRTLASDGKNVVTALSEGFGGRPDREVLRAAHASGRVVLTHDSDFGALVVRDGEPLTGIVYLRPGHIEPGFVLGMLRTIETSGLDVTPPFLLVAERRDDKVRLRLRSPS